MRLRDEFIAHDAGTESLLVPTGAAGWAGVVRGNKTLGAQNRYAAPSTATHDPWTSIVLHAGTASAILR